jgi:hypothetical protein
MVHLTEDLLCIQLRVLILCQTHRGLQKWKVLITLNQRTEVTLMERNFKLKVHEPVAFILLRRQQCIDSKAQDPHGNAP